jgi:hypothetical protein
MGNRRTISFVIVITSWDPVSCAWPQPAASRCSPRLTMRNVPRFLLSVRRECLDPLFIFQEKQLDRVLHAYVQYFNQARPHQGITQQIPEPYGEPALPDHDGGKIHSFSFLGGLHHEYRRSA